MFFLLPKLFSWIMVPGFYRYTTQGRSLRIAAVAVAMSRMCRSLSYRSYTRRPCFFPELGRNSIIQCPQHSTLRKYPLICLYTYASVNIFKDYCSSWCNLCIACDFTYVDYTGVDNTNKLEITPWVMLLYEHGIYKMEF